MLNPPGGSPKDGSPARWTVLRSTGAGVEWLRDSHNAVRRFLTPEEARHAIAKAEGGAA
jgi:hypothetical protein